MSNVILTCKEIGEPIIKKMGYNLVDIEYVKEGSNYVLRYFVDSYNGIDIDECALISEEISKILDTTEPIKQEYILEISSPGVERPLKTKEDIMNALNKYVNVRLYSPINSSKEYEGDLIDFQDDILTIKYKVKTVFKTVNIKYDQISKIRLAIKF